MLRSGLWGGQSIVLRTPKAYLFDYANLIFSLSSGQSHGTGEDAGGVVKITEPLSSVWAERWADVRKGKVTS